MHLMPTNLRRLAMLLALGFGAAGLAGCGASPAPVFFGAKRHMVEIDGYRFAVFLKADHAEEMRAEVVRLGYLSRAARDGVPARMIAAAEQVSGCKVQGPATGIWRSPSLPGDTGEARFVLDCHSATLRRSHLNTPASSP